jgi:hypothetical protein
MSLPLSQSSSCYWGQRGDTQPAVAYPDQAAPIVRVPDRGVWGAKEQILWLISGVKRSPSIFGGPMASWTFQFLTESPSALVECWAPRPATPINYPYGVCKSPPESALRHFLDDAPTLGSSKK